MRNHFLTGWVVAACILCAAATSPLLAVNVVVNGRAVGVVVVPDEPSRITQYAAEELVSHVEKATGVKLSILGESDALGDGKLAGASRIYLGPTQAAQRLGMDPASFAPEVFVLRRHGDDLYVVANEREDGNPASLDTLHAGTMFGVYELLERYLNVRWVWPGELGTYVPRTDTFVIHGALNETVEPKFQWRHLRGNFVDGDAQREVDIFQRRHRMTSRRPKPNFGHYFTGWWKKYGEEHPEWFAMDGNGKRVGPTMCVSNPQLHEKVAAMQARAYVIRLGEVDTRMYCQCDECKAWGRPEPRSAPRFARGVYDPMASNRYARFWKSVYDIAARDNPNARVTTYMYFNYTAAPTNNIKLNKNIWGEFVQSGDSGFITFPVTSETMQWLKQQWMGWKRTGMTMAYRPNILLGGYAMPYVNMRQTGEFFKFTWQNGSVGTDFNSLVPMWSVRGPQLYLLYRLHVKPELPVERILSEYYEAFGPAAQHVRAYFDYWEKHAIDRVNAGKWDSWDRVWRHYLNTLHEVFPLASFEPAEKLLDQAARAAAASPHPEFAQRVEFLRLGLEHAKLCTRLSAVYDGKPKWGEIKLKPGTPQFEEAQEIYKQIVAFRKQHTADHVLSVRWLEGYCERFWNLSDLIAE